jgi:hypothetical protein
MASAFAVSEQFLDTELSAFIVAGRLNAKIDKVNGVGACRSRPAPCHAHRITFHSSNDGSKCVGSRAQKWAWHMLLATPHDDISTQETRMMNASEDIAARGMVDTVQCAFV